MAVGSVGGGGTVGGTLITINRAVDFKQNHTPAERSFPPLRELCQAGSGVYTGVCESV